MEDHKFNRITAPKLIIAIATTILALGGVTAWLAYTSLSNRTTQNNNSSQVIQNNPEEKEEIAIYWLNDELEVVSQQIKVNPTESYPVSLTNAVNQLLAGPQTETEGTAIPENTQLHSLTIKDDGIHLDLSTEFTTGGGSAAMIGRLGQIIYTATSLDNDASVWISVDGQPLEVLGGEGLIVEQPMTRELFDQYF